VSKNRQALGNARLAKVPAALKPPQQGEKFRREAYQLDTGVAFVPAVADTEMQEIGALQTALGRPGSSSWMFNLTGRILDAREVEQLAAIGMLRLVSRSIAACTITRTSPHFTELTQGGTAAYNGNAWAVSLYPERTTKPRHVWYTVRQGYNFNLSAPEVSSTVDTMREHLESEGWMLAKQLNQLLHYVKGFRRILGATFPEGGYLSRGRSFYYICALNYMMELRGSPRRYSIRDVAEIVRLTHMQELMHAVPSFNVAWDPFWRLLLGFDRTIDNTFKLLETSVDPYTEALHHSGFCRGSVTLGITCEESKDTSTREAAYIEKSLQKISQRDAIKRLIYHHRG